MNKIKNLIYLLGLSVMVIFTGCSDPDDEVTDINYAQLFSPTDLKTNVINKTQVRMQWTSVRKAESYTVEVFENGDLNFEGTPVLTITGITDNPYVIKGLEGETSYSIRLQAVSSKIPSSKWVSFTAETAAEQIFEAVKDEDITINSVTLRWPAGETATQIVLTPGDITHNVTSGEIAAGEVTVTGLTADTKYTAKLMNGTKVRGTMEFATLIDLGGATAIRPEDDFAAIVAGADDNTVFAVFPGTYEIGKLSITKNMSIKAAQPGVDNMPVLLAVMSLEAGVSLELQGVILDGIKIGEEGSNKDHVIQFNTADAPYRNITIGGCIIKNYVKGLLYFNVKGMAESITINNCIIYNIQCDGGDFFDCRKGTAKQITFTNNTVYKSASGRDFFRIDNDNSSAFTDAPKLLVDHNTFDGVANNSGRGLFYMRWVGNSAVFTNNLVTNTEGVLKRGSANNVTTKDNNYFGAAVMAGVDSSASTYDPQFANPANRDFTVGNTDNVFSGDPRWLP